MFSFLSVRFFLKQRKGFTIFQSWLKCLLPEKILLGAPTFYLILGVTFVRHSYVYINYIPVSVAVIIGVHSNYITIFYFNTIVLFVR